MANKSDHKGDGGLCLRLCHLDSASQITHPAKENERLDIKRIDRFRLHACCIAPTLLWLLVFVMENYALKNTFLCPPKIVRYGLKTQNRLPNGLSIIHYPIYPQTVRNKPLSINREQIFVYIENERSTSDVVSGAN